MKNVLIIGAGSSGLRFAKILHRRKINVSIFLHRKSLTIPSYCKPVSSLNDYKGHDAVIIASPTSTHSYYANFFVDKGIPVFIEKPFTHSSQSSKTLFRKIRLYHAKVFVGFNLRYMPIIGVTRDFIQRGDLGKVLYCDLYSGQYLPHWRKKDYRKTYSVSRKLGGGVALDLIHEIDLAYYFFPVQQFECVSSKKMSNLTFDTEDYVMFRSTKDPLVTITIDYLNHNKTRRYRFIGTKGSIECDIVNRRFIYTASAKNRKVITEPKFFDIKQTYDTEIDKFMTFAEAKHPDKITERNFGMDALEVSLKAQSYEK